MAKPNYAFEKRQRDLLKKQKKEEKQKRKTEGSEKPAQDPGEGSLETDIHQAPE